MIRYVQFLLGIFCFILVFWNGVSAVVNFDEGNNGIAVFCIAAMVLMIGCTIFNFWQALTKD